ncbi:MAG: hypothetical protein PHD13_06370 [Methanocellales archaeon]|nr:hypothetical protein [Methanocellales archaeon]MDD3291907.1 hypothetical protein [Methanocellales archaeon]MDD5235782.1 hypothetical protein [Methanocellales archaeon]MDD5485539.1 hypothetical protein [Methanocellales archaeon]
MEKNKGRKKMELKRSRGHLIVGSVLLIFGGIAFAIFDLVTFGVGLAAPGLVLFIAGLYRATKPKTELRLDERMRRIDEKAGLFAFWLLFGTTGILFWVCIYFPARFRTTDILTILLLIGIYSYFIIRFYYNRRGLNEKQTSTNVRREAI